MLNWFWDHQGIVARRLQTSIAGDFCVILHKRPIQVCFISHCYFFQSPNTLLKVNIQYQEKACFYHLWTFSFFPPTAHLLTVPAHDLPWSLGRESGSSVCMRAKSLSHVWLLATLGTSPPVSSIRGTLQAIPPPGNASVARAPHTSWETRSLGVKRGRVRVLGTAKNHSQPCFVAVHSEQPLLAWGRQTCEDHLSSVSKWRQD